VAEVERRLSAEVAASRVLRLVRLNTRALAAEL